MKYTSLEMSVPKCLSTNSVNLTFPKKQIPWLSLRCIVGSPAIDASWRTSDLSKWPKTHTRPNKQDSRPYPMETCISSIAATLVVQGSSSDLWSYLYSNSAPRLRHLKRSPFVGFWRNGPTQFDQTDNSSTLGSQQKHLNTNDFL